MNRHSALKAVFVAALVFACQTTYAAMLNFQEFNNFQQLNAKQELLGVGYTLTTKGFIFNYTPAAGEPYPVGLMLVGKSWQYNDGSTALMSNSDDSTITLTTGDNSPFSVYTIDLAEMNGPGAVSVLFEGTTVSGQKIYQEMHLDGTPGFENFEFSDQFRNLTSMTWQQGNNVTNGLHMLDNLLALPTK